MRKSENFVRMRKEKKKREMKRKASLQKTSPKRGDDD